jgi:hypothetical protein
MSREHEAYLEEQRQYDEYRRQEDERNAQWRDDLATAIIKRVCEIDKHGPSPDDQPDLLRVTVNELRFIITSELNPD